MYRWDLCPLVVIRHRKCILIPATVTDHSIYMYAHGQDLVFSQVSMKGLTDLCKLLYVNLQLNIDDVHVQGRYNREEGG